MIFVCLYEFTCASLGARLDLASTIVRTGSRVASLGTRLDLAHEGGLEQSCAQASNFLHAGNFMLVTRARKLCTAMVTQRWRVGLHGLHGEHGGSVLTVRKHVSTGWVLQHGWLCYLAMQGTEA